MFRNMTLRKFFITITLVLLSLVVTYGVLSWVWIADLSQMDGKQNRLQRAVVRVLEAQMATIQVQQFITDVVATGNTGGLQEAKAEFARGQKALEDVAALQPALRRPTDQLQQGLQQLFTVGNEMATVYVAQGQEAGNRIMKRADDGFDAIAAGVDQEMRVLVQQLEGQADVSRNMVSTTLSSLSISTVVLAVIVSAMVIFYLWMLLSMLLNPLRDMQQKMAAISAQGGDLTQRLPARGNNEIARAERAFNQFVEGLQAVLVRVFHSIHKLGYASTQMVEVYKETMAGMQALHSEADQVATATNEMSATIQEVSGNTSAAADASGTANVISTKGQEVVEETIVSIQELANHVKTATQTLGQLQQSTAQIESILDVIRNISEQTNLLALNAAIEAARAGDAGRGFAVVADEVRTLAGRTHEATGQIQTMIERFQADTLASVGAMERGQRQAETTVGLSMKSSQALTEIREAVGTIEHMNMQIATAAAEQRSVAEEINRNVFNVADIAEKTIGTASRTGALSGQVAMLAGQTGTLLKRFEVGEFDRDDDTSVLAVWDDLMFSVGVASIDRQHQRLFDILNRLYASLLENKGRDEEQAVIEELMEYTVTHLQDEEEQMRQAQYPEYEQHKAIHDRIVGQASDLKRRYDAGDRSVAMELMMFLKDWLVDHIQKVDRRYMDSMQQHRIN